MDFRDKPGNDDRAEMASDERYGTAEPHTTSGIQTTMLPCPRLAHK